MKWPPEHCFITVRGLFQGCQVLLNFSILLLKLSFCYWNFHEILAKILKFVLISESFLHKNTEICVKLCKKTEIIVICSLRNSLVDRCPRPAKTASVQQSNCLCWSERPAISSVFFLNSHYPNIVPNTFQSLKQFSELNYHASQV